MSIIQNALRVPMKTIASNAGVEGAVIVGKVGEGTGGRGRGTSWYPRQHNVRGDVAYGTPLSSFQDAVSISLAFAFRLVTSRTPRAA